MAVSYVARKCSQCAGRLEYIKEKKIWKCMYCGAEIEREEQYDGLFTIKNVVRQALLDVSYRRLDSASQNLVECEKIDSRYVGTLIAKIAYEMITVITPGACSEHDAKSVFMQLKKNYNQLKNISSSITEEEEALYEFLEESDIYAMLILVFDALNDNARRDFAAAMLDAKEVYSKVTNGNLLVYAIKNNKLELADEIVSNTVNLDIRAALAEILYSYPDGGNKGANAELLFKSGSIKNEDRPVIEKYLASSADSIETKVSVLLSALNAGIGISIELIAAHILKSASVEQVKTVTAAVCKNKLADEEILRLVDFGFGSGNAAVALSILDCLKAANQYLLVPSRFLISMLSSNNYSGIDKAEILKKCFEFKIDSKTLESTVTNYLCYNSSPIPERKTVLEYLFEKMTAFPTNTVESYIVNCTADGEEKPNVIDAIFSKGLNISFFNDLLSKYMSGSSDPEKIKTAVIDILLKRGLKIDPCAFNDYICNSADDIPLKIRFAKQMIANGLQIRGDTADIYLRTTLPAQFSPELFGMIFIPGSIFTINAIEKYLFKMRDRAANKAANLQNIIEHSNENLSSLKCQITHLGNSISCNILQGYILKAEDPLQAAFEIVDYFINTERMKVNAKIMVSGNFVKFKNYVVGNKADLSEITDALCERYRIYTKLF